MAEQKLPKLTTRVRFPSPAPSTQRSPCVEASTVRPPPPERSRLATNGNLVARTAGTGAPHDPFGPSPRHPKRGNEVQLHDRKQGGAMARYSSPSVMFFLGSAGLGA